MDQQQMREHLFRVQDIHTATSGNLSFRAVPGLVDEFTDRCMNLFASFNRHFTAAERAGFRASLETVMREAYAASHRSIITVSYETSVGQPMQCTVSSVFRTIAEAYATWPDEQPFGSAPDARAVTLAAAVPDPGRYPVLDIGAGGGRNTLALARGGHPVDAVEVTPKFADSIRSVAGRESLDIRVIESDIFKADDALREDYGMILASELVSEFRTVEDLRGLFELAARHLTPGGVLVFNTFVNRDGFAPDELVRQCSQMSWSTIYTSDDLATATEDLPLEFVSSESVWEYEKAHQSEEIWPPTGWYREWATGVDVFGSDYGDIPIELRWLVYRKT